MSRLWLKLAPFAALSGVMNAACAPPAKLQPYYFDVRVESEPGSPLAGVPLFLDGKKVTESDRAGLAHLEVLGTEGRSLALTLACPPRHTPPPAANLRLLTFGQGAAVTLGALCAPNTRKLGVAVRALGGAGLPVRSRSRILGTTDAEGVAHVLLEGSPGEAFELTLDTSARRELRPQNPSSSLAIGASDSVVAYETEFAVQGLAPPRAVAKKATPGPVRIR